MLEKKDIIFEFKMSSRLDTIIKYYICRFPSREFSGTLFYKVQGSFEKGDLVITGIDFLLQDIGTGVSTEFEQSSDVVSYMIENNLVEDGIYQGLLHSHHSMEAFFSAVDLNTLEHEGTNRSHFLSVIVNTKGKYTGAITRVVKEDMVVRGTRKYNTFNGKTVLEPATYSYNESKVEYYMLNIISDPNSQFKELDERIKELEESKKIKTSSSNPISITTHATNGKCSWIPTSTSSKPSKEYKNTIGFSIDIRKTIIQILTCNIFQEDVRGHDIVGIAEHMVSYLDERFSIKTYQLFISNLIEYLLYWETEISDEEINILLCEFSKLPRNKYIEIIIKELESYANQ